MIIPGGVDSFSVPSFGGNTYIIVPGATAAIMGAAHSDPNSYYIGGSATVQTGAVAPIAGDTYNVTGGKLTIQSLVGNVALTNSTINLSDGGVLTNTGSGILNLFKGATVNFNGGGGTFIADGGGAFINLSGTTINFFEGGNDGKNIIRFQNMSDAPANYTITSNTGSQTITVTDANGKQLATVNVQGNDLQTGTFSATGKGPITVNSTDGSLNIINKSIVCFLAGTEIRTPTGVVLIEELQVGDEVLVRVGESDVVR
ncbi:Hint domain-containing protein, partial [Labrys portucalensis]